MKVFSTSVIAIILLLLWSCKEDNNVEVISTNSPLIGTHWFIRDEIWSGCDLEDWNISLKCTEHCEDVVYTVFNSDGTMNIVDTWITYDFNYSATENTITKTFTEYSINYTFIYDYIIESNILTLTLIYTPDNPLPNEFYDNYSGCTVKEV